MFRVMPSRMPHSRARRAQDVARDKEEITHRTFGEFVLPI